MATLDDVVTVQKNGVIAINNLSQIFKSYNEGQYTSATVTVATVITTGSGRLINISVVTAGSTTGLIYNSASTSGISVSNSLISVPAIAGLVLSGQKFSSGLTVSPGTGQAVNVTYSLDA